MVDRWNKEIDTLLVYAGLFSAILTAFNVQSYQLLTPPPATDPIIVALERISAQLSSFSVNPPSVNSTHPAFVHQDPTPPPAPRWVVWLNALWFSSLIFSLSAASVGIMVKQWLNEYNSGLSGTSRQVARLRQLRLKSLQRSRVKEIVNTLPVLLQIASALFFAGLLVLLWQLNHTVAAVGTVLVGVLIIFSVFTIILPCFTTRCSYLSPPSRALFEITRPLRSFIYLCRRQLSAWILGLYNIPIWHFLMPVFRFDNFQHEHPYVHRFCELLYPYDTSATLPWHGMELAILSKRDEELDGDMVATAYITGMDPDYLQNAAVCTTELTLSAMRTCFQAIRSANIAYWGEEEHVRPMWLVVHPCMWSGTIVSLMTASGEDWAGSSSELAAAMENAYAYMNLYSEDIQSDTPWTRLVCADFARIVHHSDHDKLPPHPTNITDLSLYYRLQTLIRRTLEVKLGNDVRRYVARVCLDKTLP
ncbi:hypothetical protein C8T65DRAFT_114199, partial [Cerioporus squamosus]